METNKTLLYEERKRRAYALILDSNGEKIWRSRSSYELLEKNYDFEDFASMEDFISHVEADDEYWNR